jgi:hypothetical protein
VNGFTVTPTEAKAGIAAEAGDVLINLIKGLNNVGTKLANDVGDGS